MIKPIRLGKQITNLKTPRNISYLWGGGSILGVLLTTQIVTGILITMHYTPRASEAFASINHIRRDISMGWLLRDLHANGASIFFAVIYIHMGRGIYFKSFLNKKVWIMGRVIYLATMATAFMGYLLPWGQIRFWGATVITNLFSAIPYVGANLVSWLWGGYAVNSATLSRFFALHFLIPLVIAVLVLAHLTFLHETGSSNPLIVERKAYTSAFHPLFTYKDLVGIILVLGILFMLAVCAPNLLGDPENFMRANRLVTPTHIKPEWYFLWAYTILRRIPNKLGGVIAIFRAIIILFIIPWGKAKKQLWVTSILTWILITAILILTWIGGSPGEYPYETVGQWATVAYFILIFSIIT